MDDLKIGVSVEATGNGIQQTTQGLQQVAGAAEKVAPAVEEASAALDAVGGSAAPAVAAITEIAPAAQPAAEGLSELGAQAVDAGKKIEKTGESAQWTADQIQQAAPKFDADPLVAFAQQAKVAGDALDDDAQGLVAFARGAEQAASSVKPLAPAAKQAATGSKDLSTELGRGIEVSRAASMAVDGLAQANQGGVAGFVAMTRAAFGAGVAIKGLNATMGIVGAVAAGIGIAFGLITAAIRKTEDDAKSAQEMLDKLNKQKLDEAVKQQKALEDAADSALKKIEAEYTGLQRLADAELARRKSAIDASDKSPEEKTRLKTSLDRQREDEKRVALLGATEAKARTLEELAAKTAAAEKEQAAAYERKKYALDRLAAAESRAAATPAATNMAGIATANPEYARAQENLTKAREAARGFSQAQLDDEKQRLKDAKAATEAAQKTAAEARAAADLEANIQRAETPKIAETRKNEDRAKVEPTEAEKAAIEKRQRIADYNTSNVAPSIIANQILAGMPVDLESAKRVYPAYKFPAAPAWKQAQQQAPLTPTSTAAAAAEVEAQRKAEEEKRKTSGGSITTADGRTIPVAPSSASTPAAQSTMIGADGRVVYPGAGGAPALGGGTITGPGGQVQQFPAGGQPAGPGRGAYREGDNKLADQAKELGDTMQQAGDKAQEKVDLQPAVDGAKKVQEGQEQLRDSLDQATQSQAQAMEAARAAADASIAKLGEVVSAQNALRADFAALQAQVRSMRVA